MTARDKNFFTFFIFALIVWSGSWWTYYAFMKVVHMPYWSEAKLIKIIAETCLFLALIYTVIQIVALKKEGVSFLTIAGKVVLSCLGLYCIYILVSLKPNAEGLDIVFVFALALLTGFIKSCFNLKVSFGKLLLAWLLILFINEMGIQRFLLSDIRSGTMVDVRNDMIGVVIGLVLNMRWFWRK